MYIYIKQDAFRREGNRFLQTLTRNETRAELTCVTCCLSRFGGNEEHLSSFTTITAIYNTVYDARELEVRLLIVPKPWRKTH